jgi:hypothetical protein
MKRRIYTDIEIKILKQNMFICDVKYLRQIEYDPLFKLWCIYMKLNCPELTAREIFERAGMNIEILHPSLPRRRIQEWIYNYNKFGKNYFIPEDKPYTINDSFKQQLYKIVNGEL